MSNDPFDLSPEPNMDTSFLSDVVAPTRFTGSSGSSDPTDSTDIQTFKMSKGGTFRQLTKALALNEYSLPDYIYRADLIPPNLYDYNREDRNSLIEAAILPIAWDHGYPSIADPSYQHAVTPLWERLPGETAEAFNAFMQYLELPQSSDSNNPVRMLPLLATALNLSYDSLSDYSFIYFWKFRFRAYDLFLTACHQKQKEQRIMSIEGKHFKAADRYLNKLDQIIEARLDHTIRELAESDSAIHDDLKLKDLVDMVEKLTRIQRVSVGLPVNGDDKNEHRQLGQRNQSIDDSYREIAAAATQSKKNDNRSQEMDLLLTDPEALAKAQDLIIRAATHKPGQGN